MSGDGGREEFPYLRTEYKKGEQLKGVAFEVGDERIDVSVTGPSDPPDRIEIGYLSNRKNVDFDEILPLSGQKPSDLPSVAEAIEGNLREGLKPREILTQMFESDKLRRQRLDTSIKQSPLFKKISISPKR